MAATTVAIDIEDGQNLAIASHAISQVDRSAAVSKFLEVRHDGLELEQRITSARDGSHPSAAWVVVVRRACNQNSIAVMLEALFHLFQLVCRNAVFLDKRKSGLPLRHARFMGRQ